jgi:hypothetical protein
VQEPTALMAASPPRSTATPVRAPLYTIAVVPDYGEKDFHRHQYGAWYVSHPDEGALAPERLQAYFDAGRASGEIDPAAGEVMADFAADLEAQGYIVQQTAGEGYVVIITSADEAATADSSATPAELHRA